MRGISVRPGVVLIELKGTYMLVSTKEARKVCPYVLRINCTGAHLWEMLKDNCSFEQILADFQEKYEIDDPDKLETDLHACIDQLKERGYLCQKDRGGTNFE